jgi:hypothetical protein
VFEPVLGAPIFQATGAAIILPAREVEGVTEAAIYDASLQSSGHDGHIVGVDGKYQPRLRDGADADLRTSLVTESFQLHLVAHNPLDIAIRLTEIRVHAENTSPLEDGLNIEDALDMNSILDLEIPPLATKSFNSRITLTCPTTVRFTRIEYLFHGLMRQSEALISRGKRLTAEKRHRLAEHYKDDLSLRVTAQPSIARLSAEIQTGPVTASQGIHQRWGLKMDNIGTLPITTIWVKCNHSRMFTRQQSEAAALAARRSPNGQDDDMTIKLIDLASRPLGQGEAHEVELRSCFLHSGEFDLEFEVLYQATVSQGIHRFARGSG